MGSRMCGNQSTCACVHNHDSFTFGVIALGLLQCVEGGGGAGWGRGSRGHCCVGR